MWSVKEATSDDADGISSLYRRVWSEYTGKLPDPLLEDRMPDSDKILGWMKDRTYFISLDGERVVGVVRCKIVHGTCLLDRMVVDGTLQRKGVGTTLIDRVVEFAREQQVPVIWLHTNAKLTWAIAFYKKMGFVECGHFRKHHWGDDVKFFEMVLE
jgi:GNAT superfamily N-acetyltransferase